MLAEKMKEIKAIYDELVEAGAITPDSPLATEGMQELSEDDLDKAAGGLCGCWRMADDDEEW